MQERIDGGDDGIQNLAAAGFGDATQEIEIRLGGAELRRIIDAGADGLEAAHLAVFDIHEVEHIEADFFGRKTSFVMAGPGLLQMDGLALAFRTGYVDGQIEEIAVVALFIERLDANQSFAFIDGHFGGEIGVFETPKAPLANLRPELPVFLPVQPDFSPACFGVGSEGDGAA